MNANAAEDRLRILHLVAPGVVGGLERVVSALAVGHQRLGHDVHVAVVLGQGEECHPFVAPLTAAGVEVDRLILPGRAYWRERRLVGHLCRRLRPNVVHSHSVRTDVVDAGVARRMGYPTVTTIHGASLMGGKARIYEWLQQRSYRQFDGVVAVSRPLADEAIRGGVPPERVHLVPNAWPGDEVALTRAEARRELGLDSGAFVIGWVGRMIRVKGGDIFLRALSHLPAEMEFDVVLVGDGPEESTLKQEAQRSRIRERIRFVGEREDAGRLFPAFDLFVLSSRSEGVPIVLFEAIAAGVPVIAARVGGVPDVLTDSAGFLVPPEDALSLAEAIHRAYTERTDATNRAAHASRRLTKCFSREPWLARYEQIYRQIVDRAADRRRPRP